MCTLTAVASTSTSTLQIRQQQKPAQGPFQAIGMNNLSGVAVGDPQGGTVGPQELQLQMPVTQLHHTVLAASHIRPSGNLVFTLPPHTVISEYFNIKE